MSPPNWLAARAAPLTIEGLFVRLRRESQVWLDGAMPLRELSWNLVVAHAWNDDAIIAILPVCWCRDLVVRGQLERIDHSDQLIEVTAGRRRGKSVSA